MKTLTKILMPGLLLVAACARQGDPVPASRALQEEPDATLTIQVLPPGTKATSVHTDLTDQEQVMNNIQVCAFTTVYTYRSGVYFYNPTTLSSFYAEDGFQDKSSVTTSLHSGMKRMFILANWYALEPHELTDWASLEEQEMDTAQWIGNDVGAFPMEYGLLEDWELEIAPGTNRTVPVTLRRMVSRLVLGSITNDLHADYGTAVPKSVSLLDVPKSLCLDGVIIERPYYNPMGQDFSTQALCEASGGTYTYASIDAAPDGSFDPVVLYTFPGSHVHLMVAVDFTKDATTTTYYYAVPLKNLDFNCTYDIDLHLRNLGSTDPANPAITHASAFTVTPGEWEAMPAIEELM